MKMTDVYFDKQYCTYIHKTVVLSGTHAKRCLSMPKDASKGPNLELSLAVTNDMIKIDHL
jgi:hypothetical protein